LETWLKSEEQLKVLTGNAAAAYAVALCRPDVISAYPITPQTELVEVLYRLMAEGQLECEAVEPEGEHSVMSVLRVAPVGRQMMMLFTLIVSSSVSMIKSPEIL